ncbi:MAG TPA: sigma-70 family RNA polymerase sigma factor [Candidatus Dormibacteraeota bacterium]|nr:sigma-70 family RNA polymerase sigma factor [Candidatus Dormibacteraeota bacterium]
MTGGLRLNLEPSQDPPPSGDESLDHERLGVAFLTHRGELLGFARRSLGDESLAEEAVQETFVRALRARPGFDPKRGAMRAWLFSIERRIIVDLARARRAHPSQELDPNSLAAADQIEAAMRAWNVEEALRRLGPDHRLVVLEIYYRGRPSREVARQLGVPEGTVRSRLYYALRALRVLLDDMGWSE